MIYNFTIRVTDESVPPQVVDKAYSWAVDTLAYLAVGYDQRAPTPSNLSVRQTPGFGEIANPIIFSSVESLAFSVAGDRIALGVSGDTGASEIAGLRIFNPTTRQFVSGPSIVADTHAHASYRSDNQGLLVRYSNGEDNSLAIFNPATNALIHTKSFDSGTGWQGEVAYAPNANHYAANYFEVVQGEIASRTVLYSSSTNNSVAITPLAPISLKTMHFLSDSSLLATGHGTGDPAFPGGGFAVLDVPAMTTFHGLSLGTEVFCVRFSPDGNYLAVSTSSGVFVHEVGFGFPLVWSQTNIAPMPTVNALTWAPSSDYLLIATRTRPWVRTLLVPSFTFANTVRMPFQARGICFSPALI